MITTLPVIVHNEGGVTIYAGDCHDLIPLIKGVDLVVTDPPWMFNRYTAQIAKEKAVTEASEADWFGRILGFYVPWMCALQTAGIQKMWCFLGWFQIAPFLRVATLIGWHVQHIAIKPNAEWLVYLGPEPLGQEDVSWIDHQFREAPYAPVKSVELIRLLILATECKGPVLDPFAGTGSTLKAARKAGNAAIGIELDPELARKAMEL